MGREDSQWEQISSKGNRGEFFSWTVKDKGCLSSKAKITNGICYLVYKHFEKSTLWGKTKWNTLQNWKKSTCQNSVVTGLWNKEFQGDWIILLEWRKEELKSLSENIVTDAKFKTIHWNYFQLSWTLKNSPQMKIKGSYSVEEEEEEEEEEIGPGCQNYQIHTDLSVSQRIFLFMHVHI